MDDPGRHRLLTEIRDLMPAASHVTPEEHDGLPEARGAYALVIGLGAPVDYRGRHRFASGWYVYAGSAYGPGGLSARLRRHVARSKAIRWHVDHLTTAAARLEALAVEGGSECAIVAALARSPAFTVPLAGFGSSDCRRCVSHLLAWRPVAAGA